MAKVGIGRIMGVGGSTAARLPAVLTRDKAFPFVESDEIVVEIKGKSLVVSKA